MKRGLGIGATVLIMSAFLAPVIPQEGGDDPGKSVLEKMKKDRGTELEIIKDLKTEVLVVEGHYDRVQKVLDGLQIKYDLIKQSDLPNKDLSPYVAVLINCYGEQAAGGGMGGPDFGPGGGGQQFGPGGGGQQFGPGGGGGGGGGGAPGMGALPARDVPKNVREKIRAYVESGGYLFTSDWAIVLTEKTFPEFLKQVGPTGAKNETIDVKPKEEHHPFLKDVFTTSAPGGNTGLQKKLRKADWMIENRSLTFDIVAAAKSAVKVLVVSDDLQKRYSSQLVAVTFDVKPGSGGLATGKDLKAKKAGVVFHVIGHFYQQGLGNKDNSEVAKMYQMIVNFILEAKKTHTTAKK